MSSVKPISAPTSPLHPTTPSPPKPRDLVTRSLRSCARPQNRDPLFSTACALFLIHNYPDPLCFVIAAHSLPKTPGGSIGISGQIPSEVHRVPLTPTESVSSKRLTLNPIESYSFTRITPKPNGILLFQNDAGGWGTIATTIQVPVEQTPAPVTPMDAISFATLPFNLFRIYLFRKWGGGGVIVFSQPTQSIGSHSSHPLPVCPSPGDMLGSLLQNSCGGAPNVLAARALSPSSLP